MSICKFTVVCVAVLAICGCDRGQPTPTVASNLKPVATPVEEMELPISATSIGMKFKLIPAGTFTMGDASGEDDETPHEAVSYTHLTLPTSDLV